MEVIPDSKFTNLAFLLDVNDSQMKDEILHHLSQNLDEDSKFVQAFFYE